MNKYARLFLGPDEYKYYMKVSERMYFSMLAKKLLTFQGRRVFVYHQRGLATIGQSLLSRNLVKYVFLAILDMVLNPKMTVGRLLRLQ